MTKYFFALLLPAFVACNQQVSHETTGAEDVIPVAIEPIDQQAGSIVTEATGTFTTDNETMLSFKNGGIIQKIYVREGDRIKRGQLLATLNMTEINARAAQARLALQKAERDFQRAKQLYKDSVATMEQMENARTALDVARQDLNSVNFNLQQSQLRATSGGYVLMKLANEGQVVGPGMPVIQISGEGGGKWLAKVGVSDRQWASIRVGDRATITTDAVPDEIAATVVRKSEAVDPRSGTFQIFVKPVDAGGLRVASGMFVRVQFRKELGSAWLIPYEAFLDGGAGKAYAFVTDDQQTAQKVEITTGALMKDKVEVLSGLEGHKYLIIAGSPYLKDGSKIKVHNN